MSRNQAGEVFVREPSTILLGRLDGIETRLTPDGMIGVSGEGLGALVEALLTVHRTDSRPDEELAQEIENRYWLART